MTLRLCTLQQRIRLTALALRQLRHLRAKAYPTLRAGRQEPCNLVVFHVSSGSTSAGQGPPYENTFRRAVGRAKARRTSYTACVS